MRPEQRKAVIAAYKERKVASGIYAVRRAATGEIWVGRAPDLSTVWNRLSFTLAQGAHSSASLQSAWRAAHGEGFAFERLEPIEEDVANVRDRLMKERLEHWRAELGAEII